MKDFETIQFDAARCRDEVQEFRDLLASKSVLKERKDILPFFKKRKHLSAYLGCHHPEIVRFDLVAHEFPLFGDFTCDLVAGDSKNHAFTFIEFEDARPDGIFARKRGKTTPVWSPRFEQGFSQLVDWFYKLHDEGNTAAFEDRFGARTIRHLGLLVIGRGGDGFGIREQQRLRWRQEHVLINSKHVLCKTFDQLCDELHDRLERYPLASKAEGEARSSGPPHGIP
jgi:hypothetical protein